MKKLEKILKELLSKKYVANILVLLALAVIALIVTTDFKPKPSSTRSIENNLQNDQLVLQQNNKSEEEVVETRLKKILENIEGAGKVEVMVTFEMGSEIIPASNTVATKDTTEEKDSNGGTRVVTSENITENVVTTNDQSGNKPLVLKEIKPQVKGVIVVAEGAENIEVKKHLYDAVKTVLQVSGNRVEIYTKK